MEPKLPTEVVVPNYLSTRRHIPDKNNFHGRRWEEFNRPKYIRFCAEGRTKVI
jgi:hypothetical protein